MPKIRSITRLKRKRAEIAASIKLHEKQLAKPTLSCTLNAAHIRRVGKAVRHFPLCRLLPAIQAGRALGEIVKTKRSYGFGVVRLGPFARLTFTALPG